MWIFQLLLSLPLPHVRCLLNPVFCPPLDKGQPYTSVCSKLTFPGGSGGKQPACKAGGLCLIPELGRSPGGKWQPTHSSVLAWSTPWTEEPGGLRSTWSQRVRHDWVTQHTRTQLTGIIIDPSQSKAENQWEWKKGEKKRKQINHEITEIWRLQRETGRAHGEEADTVRSEVSVPSWSWFFSFWTRPLSSHKNIY